MSTFSRGPAIFTSITRLSASRVSRRGVQVEFQENVETGVIPIYSFDIPRESGDGLWDVSD